MAVRYIDNYAREADGKWRFAKRVVIYDMRTNQPFTGKVVKPASPAEDPSFAELAQRLFQRGARA